MIPRLAAAESAVITITVINHSHEAAQQFIVQTEIPFARLMIMSEPRESFARIKGQEFTEKSITLFMSDLIDAVREKAHWNKIESYLFKLGMIGWIIDFVFNNVTVEEFIDSSLVFTGHSDNSTKYNLVRIVRPAAKSFTKGDCFSANH